jgi:hypothetical protein
MPHLGVTVVALMTACASTPHLTAPAVFAGGTVPAPLPATATQETYHGVVVSDPYRFLENVKDPAVQQWMSQDAFSRNTRLQLKQLFDALRALMTPPDPPRRPIGCVTSEDKKNRTSGQEARPDPFNLSFPQST